MTTPERFAPPKAPVEAGQPVAVSPSRRPFPWLLVLRYVVGALVTVTGLISLYGLTRSWAILTDRAFIDPHLAPQRFVPVIVLKIATGLAILARRKESLAVTPVWAIAFVYLILSNGPLGDSGPDFFLNLGALIALFALQCLLLARGLLR